MKSVMVKGLAVAAALAGVGAGAGAGLAGAQTPHASTPPAGSVDDYLCTFAGKCGGASDGAEPSMAAPATKSFRLAAPSAAAARPAAAAAHPAATQAATATAVRPRAADRVRPATVHAVRRPPAGTHANLQLAFGYNSDQLTDQSKDRARVFATALAMPELKSQRFLISGHTDSRGSRVRNLDLSRRRAQSVADFLVAQGVAADRVEVKGYGSGKPLPHMAPSAEANRRVEAVLLS